MSAPKIRIVVDIVPGAPKFVWWCEACPDEPPNFGREAHTIAAAADAGREHLRQAHPEVVWTAGGSVYGKQPRYSRPCGVSLAACEAQTCRCVSVDPEAEIVAQEARLDGDQASAVHRCSGDVSKRQPTTTIGTPNE